VTGLDDRVVRERVFHDERFADGGDPRPADRFYAINAASSLYCTQSIESLAPGATLLDYGCGAGAHAALHAARRGHRVTAIDISPAAIEQARREARRQGLAGRIDFRVENAEDLQLEPASFDMVCGLGVIHHLDLAVAMREVVRVLRPAGTAVFVEPLGHNPAINLYRSRTPDQRSEDEHPLLLRDLDIVRAPFARSEVRYFHLLGLLALPFAGSRRRRGIVARLDAADRVLLRTPARRWAWMAGIRLAAPRAVPL
jgi:SAM-dependent methyltransferase